MYNVHAVTIKYKNQGKKQSGVDSPDFDNSIATAQSPTANILRSRH